MDAGIVTTVRKHARRRHRRRLRPARRAGAGPHEAPPVHPHPRRRPLAEVSMQRHSRIVALAAALILGACASKNAGAAEHADRHLADQGAGADRRRSARRSAPISRPATTSAARWTSRSTSSARRPSLDPNNAQHLQRVRPRLHGDGRRRKAEENFRRALALAPNDSEIHHNWGVFLCSSGRAAEVDPRVRAGVPQSALPHAGDRADQRRQVQRVDRRRRARRAVLPPGADRRAEPAGGRVQPRAARVPPVEARRGARAGCVR